MTMAMRGLVWMVLASLCEVLPACAPPEIWSTAAPMPEPRYAAAGAVINGKLYVAGGYNGRALATVIAYDPARDAWETKASMPTARINAAASVMDGKLYIIGGISSSNATLNTVEVYDPASDSWKASSPMSAARFSPSVVSVNGKLYVAGGGRDNAENPGVPRNTIERFDPVTAVWTTLSSTLPTALYDSAYGVIDGKFYLAGGWDGTGKTNILEVFDPATDSWSVKSSMAYARQVPAFAVIRDRFYVAGGWDRTANDDLAVLEVYDPRADAWTTKTSMKVGREQPVGAGTGGGRFTVVGGYRNGPQSTNEVLHTEWNLASIQAWLRTKFGK